ncbi:hypothetical protein OJJOAM_004209 [Cupriavidus sp. H18C1]
MPAAFSHGMPGASCDITLLTSRQIGKCTRNTEYEIAPNVAKTRPRGHADSQPPRRASASHSATTTASAMRERISTISAAMATAASAASHQPERPGFDAQ